MNPGSPESAAGELEAEDLVEAGVPEALAGRLAEGAGALAAHLSGALVVAYHSGEFAEAQEAKQASSGMYIPG